MMLQDKLHLELDIEILEEDLLDMFLKE